MEIIFIMFDKIDIYIKDLYVMILDYPENLTYNGMTTIHDLLYPMISLFNGFTVFIAIYGYLSFQLSSNKNKSKLIIHFNQRL